MVYIILSNYVRSILFCWDKHCEISQTWFHVCMKLHCCKKHVCERKSLFGQPNTLTSDREGHFYNLIVRHISFCKGSRLMVKMNPQNDVSCYVNTSWRLYWEAQFQSTRPGCCFVIISISVQQSQRNHWIKRNWWTTNSMQLRIVNNKLEFEKFCKRNRAVDYSWKMQKVSFW